MLTWSECDGCNKLSLRYDDGRCVVCVERERRDDWYGAAMVRYCMRLIWPWFGGL